MASMQAKSFIVLAVVVAIAAVAQAAGGDFNSIDLAASAPYSYTHTTGGGAWNDKTNAVDKDMVESLEGDQFHCGDRVTHLLLIQTGSSVADASQDVELRCEFLADTTGQSGVAYTSILGVQLNEGMVENGDNGTSSGGGPGVFGLDSGMKISVPKTVTVLKRGISGPAFTAGSVAYVEVRVGPFVAGETAILRIDARIACLIGSHPTGNLQGSLMWAKALPPGKSSSAISTGQQTVPLKSLSGIHGLDCDEDGTLYTGTNFTATVVVTRPDGAQTVGNEFKYSWPLGSYLLKNEALGTVHMSTFDYACSADHSGEYIFEKSSCGCEAVKLNYDQPQLFFDVASSAFVQPGVEETLNGVATTKYTSAKAESSMLYLWVKTGSNPVVPVRVQFRDGTIWDFSNVQFTVLTKADFEVLDTTCTCRRRSDIILLFEKSKTTSVAMLGSARTFGSKLVDQFVVGPSNVQIGVMTYGTSAATILGINSGTTALNVKNSINAISCSSTTASASCTSDTDGDVVTALTAATTELYSSARSFVTKTVVFVTDGWSNPTAEVLAARDKAIADGINVIVVAYQSLIDEVELATLVTDPTHVVQKWSATLLASGDTIDVASRICLLNDNPCGTGCCGICDSVCQTCNAAQTCAAGDDCTTSTVLVGKCCVTGVGGCPDQRDSCRVGTCNADTKQCEYENTCTGPDTACYDYVCQSGTCTKKLKQQPSDDCHYIECVDNALVEKAKSCSANTECSQTSCVVGKGCVTTNSPDITYADECLISKCTDPDGYANETIAGCFVDCPTECTSADKCAISYCGEGAKCVTEDKECTASNLCEIASCDPATGGCAVTLKSCDDSNPCTVDSCDVASGGCVHQNVTCDAVDKCNVGACDVTTGACSTTPVDCDDGIACTIDACDPAVGCTHTPSNGHCNDGNLCVTGTCDASVGCVYSDLPCEAGENGCQIPTCIAYEGCTLSARVCNASEDSCDTAFCDEDQGNCTIQANDCAPAVAVDTVVSTTLGAVAIAGVVIAAVVVLAVTGGGVAAAVTTFNSAGTAAVVNNPLYVGGGHDGNNPLHRG